MNDLSAPSAAVDAALISRLIATSLDPQKETEDEADDTAHDVAEYLLRNESGNVDPPENLRSVARRAQLNPSEDSKGHR